MRSGLPFDVCIPNDKTAEDLRRSEAGIDVHTAKDADDLFEQLGI